MSRSFSDDFEEEFPNEYAFFEKRLETSLAGKRGQNFLKELAAEMDAMPVKELVKGDLVTKDGACCALGVVCKSRKINVEKLDPDEHLDVANVLDISLPMAGRIAWLNDDDVDQNDADRWKRMRKWVSEQIQVTDDL